MRKGVFGGALALVACGLGCGHTAVVRPVPKGAIQPELQLGGPIARVNGALTLPLPLVTAGARYGLSDKLDLSLNAHLTTLLFGVAGLDFGSAYLAMEQEGARPAVTVAGRLYGFMDVPPRGGPRPYAELAGTASWKARGWLTPYVSASALVQFAGAWPLLSAGAGAELSLGRFGLQAEARWYAPYDDSRFAVVDWWSVGGWGAWGVVFGLSYRLGGEP